MGQDAILLKTLEGGRGREGGGEREREREKIFNIFIHDTEILIKV